jgi:hypothetical protein
LGGVLISYLPYAVVVKPLEFLIVCFYPFISSQDGKEFRNLMVSSLKDAVMSVSYHPFQQSCYLQIIACCDDCHDDVTYQVLCFDECMLLWLQGFELLVKAEKYLESDD